MATKTLTEKPSIYILHGWAPNTDQTAKWRPFLSQLQPFFNVKLLSLPGLDHSFEQAARLSSQLPKKGWETADYLKWLSHVLPDKPCILIGHSFGGRLATHLAITQPNQVAKLILIDAAGVRDMSWRSQVKRQVFHLASGLLSTLKQIEWLRKVVYGIAGERDYLHAPVELRHTMAEAVRDDLRSSLGRVAQPTLVIWGQSDQTTPAWMGRVFAKQIPNSHLEIIADARHAPQFTHPVETARAVLNFLEVPSA